MTAQSLEQACPGRQHSSQQDQGRCCPQLPHSALLQVCWHKSCSHGIQSRGTGAAVMGCKVGIWESRDRQTGRQAGKPSHIYISCMLFSNTMY
jgi:hypothetical protein